MAIQRPLKEGSVRTYQEKVALNFLDILASEMDADLDTIYTAWNGRLATDDIQDGAVTTAKLADPAVTSSKLADQAVTAPKCALGLTVRQRVQVQATGQATGAMVTLATLPAMTLRGAGVSVLCTSDATMYFGFTTVNTWLRCRLHLFRDSTEFWSRDHMANVPAAQWVPVPGLVAIDYNVPAGSHVYSLRASIPNGPAAITVDTTIPGWVFAYELL